MAIGSLLRRGAARAVGDLTALALPVECAGCGRWDVALCDDCLDLFRGPPVRCEAAAPLLADLVEGAVTMPVWRLATYAGPARGVVLAWKASAAPALSRPLAAAARAAGAALGNVIAAADGPCAERGRAARMAGPTRALAVVPAPSGWHRRATGRLVVRDVARAVASGLGERSAGRVSAVDALRRAGGGRHQSGLGAAGRRENRRATMRLVRTVPPGSPCVLVDDVLTTGATLSECRRALRDAGLTVLGALVMAATPGVVPGQGGMA